MPLLFNKLSINFIIQEMHINYIGMLSVVLYLTNVFTLCSINTGLFGILWYVAWFVLAFESPSVHPTITEDERAYIELSAVNVDEVSHQG